MTFVKGGPYDYYVDALPRLGVDIGIIPIVDSEFNKSKSSVKYAEYCATGLPSVISNFLPYRGLIKNGVNGFTALNEKQWYEKLMVLIQKPDVRDRIAHNCLKKAKEFSLDVNGHYWTSLVNNLLISDL